MPKTCHAAREAVQAPEEQASWPLGGSTPPPNPPPAAGRSGGCSAYTAAPEAPAGHASVALIEPFREIGCGRIVRQRKALQQDQVARLATVDRQGGAERAGLFQPVRRHFIQRGFNPA